MDHFSRKTELAPCHLPKMRGKKAKLPVRYLGRIMLSIPTARVSSRLDISDIAVNCMWN